MKIGWYFYVGLIAAIAIAIYTIPQLIRVIRTKQTADLSVVMLCLLVFGDFCFILNGIGILADKDAGTIAKRISAGLPIFLGNFIAFMSSTALLVYKLRNMHYAKKFQTTEKQFCDNYESYRTKIRIAKAEKEAAKKVSVPKDPTTPIAG